jgi:membrane protease YdiL (CAAX protease family)
VDEPARPVRPTVIAPPPPAIARRPVRPPPPEVRPRRRPDRARPASVVPLMLAVGTFAAMMAVSFGQVFYGLLTQHETADLPEAAVRQDLVRQMAVFEGLDTLIVVAGILVAGRPLARAAGGDRLVAWLLSVPGFALLLGFNLAYHLTLRLLAEAVAPPEQVPEMIDITLGHEGWWAVLLVCVQPAVVEEVFFRYLLLGHLRSHMGKHAAVWLSAVVFGMAHLGNIPGWPVLICLGAGLGYARVYSGGLALPIALHFLHNLAVLGIGEVLAP